jgi:hypothetical protein
MVIVLQRTRAVSFGLLECHLHGRIYSTAMRPFAIPIADTLRQRLCRATVSLARSTCKFPQNKGANGGTRTPGLLITSDRSYVAGVCGRLHNAHS